MTGRANAGRAFATILALALASASWSPSGSAMTARAEETTKKGTGVGVVGNVLPGDSREPVIIEADDGIEWRQKEKVYVARGNARAIRGDVTVQADTLTAHYRENEKGKTDVWKVVAQGNVVITSKNQRITGDRGVYNVDNGVFLLTGKALKLETPDETVTARDKLEYRIHERTALVVGNAVALRDDKKIKADRFVAQFKEDATGKLSLDQVRATGNVVIVTANEIARADRGVYNATTGIATLTGSVRLTRGDNQMNGARAEIDFNTGVSRLLADPAGGGRVRGLFMPGRDGGKLDLKVPGRMPGAPGKKK